MTTGRSERLKGEEEEKGEEEMAGEKEEDILTTTDKQRVQEADS